MKKVSLCLMILLAVSGTMQAQKNLTKGIQLCILEKIKHEGILRVNFTPYAETEILNLLDETGLKLGTLPSVPLVSKEIVEYTVLSTTGMLSTFAGFLHLEAGPDGSLKFTSDRGATAVLKTEVTSVHWIIDRQKAMQYCRKLGSRYLLFVEVQSEDITPNLSHNEQYSGQRSIATSMNAILIDAGDSRNRVIHSYGGHATRMNAVESVAIREGVRILGSQLAKNLLKVEEIQE